jgi:N-acetylmuramoyl-L-alanine amidase
MEIISQPSPNFDTRGGQPVDLLVLHYTGMQSGAEALERMCSPLAKVSAHYMVEEDGRVFQLVDEAERAWHAGISHWGGVGNVNANSIGIEIVNPGHEWGYRPFPQVQMQAVAALAQGILARHPRISPRNVVGHSDIAPERKEDPGELFDWAGLAQAGIGLWHYVGEEEEAHMRQLFTEHEFPDDLMEGDAHRAVMMMQRGLQEYGYGIPVTGLFDTATTAVVRAFQRHFYPQKLDGVWDAPAQARLEALLTSS